MVRAAAKNFESVAVATNVDQYQEILRSLAELKGNLHRSNRWHLAREAFLRIAQYDIAIANYFHDAETDAAVDKIWNEYLNPFFQRMQFLRYGENPHQKAAFFGDLNELFDQLNGKELSYNNLVDVDAAVQIIKE